MWPKENFDQISKLHFRKFWQTNLNGHITGLCPQTQKLEPPYKTLPNTLAVKGLNLDAESKAFALNCCKGWEYESFINVSRERSGLLFWYATLGMCGTKMVVYYPFWIQIRCIFTDYALCTWYSVRFLASWN